MTLHYVYSPNHCAYCFLLEKSTEEKENKEQNTPEFLKNSKYFNETIIILELL